MRLYSVYLYCLNGNTIKIGMMGENYTIVEKVKEMLQDNGGGTAEIRGDSFYTVVDCQ